MKKVATVETVKSAIQQITERGEKPTIARIRTITGGSPKTICEIKATLDSNVDDQSTLPLFESVIPAAASLSHHNVNEKIDVQIMKRVDSLVMRRLDLVLSRLEGGPQEEATPLRPSKLSDPLPNPPEKKGAPNEELGAMRELWLDACNQLADASSQIKELEQEKEKEAPSHNEKGDRVFKNELALAVRHLVMTVGMSQTDVAGLLGINSNDVSRLKNQGTTLHRKRAKSE